MYPGLLIYYGIALTIILVGGLLCFIWLKHIHFLLRLFASLLIMSLLVLIWPLPIHGGFMILGESIYKEWRKDRQRVIHRDSTNRQQQYLDSLNQRFRGELPIKHLTELSSSWASVAYDENKQAWLDTASGQIWSDWLALPVTDALPSLEIGKSHCSELIPAGFWSLPTEAEHIIMRRNGGSDILPKTEGASMAYIIDTDFKMEMPTYRLTASSNFPNQKYRQFNVRCIARGPGGPSRGYIKQDISLTEWNHYQLSKLNH
jgi:hypothetical protein